MGRPLRLACIASGADNTRRSLNEIHAACGIDLVILEESPLRPSRHQQRPGGDAVPLPRRIRRRLGAELRRVRETGRRATGRLEPVSLDAGIATLRVTNATDPVVRESLDSLRPDVLLAYNASLLDDTVLATAGTSLNVHWGLAPWYRGLYTTAWALLGWDPHGIGVTVHHMSAVIDGGPIAAQVATPPRRGDSYGDLAARQRDAATEVTIRCLTRLGDGRALPAVRQDLGKGRLYTAEQWSPALSIAVRDLLADDGAARMLERPSRPGPVEIVELGST